MLNWFVSYKNKKKTLYKSETCRSTPFKTVTLTICSTFHEEGAEFTSIKRGEIVKIYRWA